MAMDGTEVGPVVSMLGAGVKVPPELGAGVTDGYDVGGKSASSTSRVTVILSGIPKQASFNPARRS